MASRQAPLEPHEIPEEYRDTFRYNTQALGPSGNRNVLKIERNCSVCDNTYQVVVYNIRGDLRRGRKMRAAKCKDCRGRYRTKEGYIWIHKPDHPNAYNQRYVPEHILVMEQKLGRYVDSKNESVHHINGIHDDNNITNLQLRKRFHGKGQKWQCGDCGSHNILASELD